jgi:alpha-glucosidase
MRQIFLLLISIGLFTCNLTERKISVQSPDNQTKVVVSFIKVNDNSTLSYLVVLNNDTVIKWSDLGISLISKEQSFSEGLEIISVKDTVIIDSYINKSGKKKVCNIKANQKIIRVANKFGKQADFVFWVSDEAVAFRYELFNAAEDTVLKENSTFDLGKNAEGWVADYSCDYEQFYSHRIVDTMKLPEYILPAIFKTSGGKWVYIHEASVYGNYGACEITHTGNGALQIRLPDKKYWWKSPAPGTWEEIVDKDLRKIIATPNLQTPWRVIILGNNLAKIVESTAIEDLNPPCELSDTSWIEPGIAVFPWWGNPEANDNPAVLKSYIDLAKEMNWKYLEFDIGLLGNKGGYAIDFWRNVKYIPDIVSYANSKGIGIYGWDERKFLNTPEKRADIFGTYKKLGIKGIKIDFLNSDKQASMKFREDALRDAAKYNLLVSFHGDISPRGMRRKFPNLMTQEGVKGSEYYLFASDGAIPNPVHNCTLPFTRNIAGPMDYTPVAFSTHRRTSTYAHELALPVIYESGWVCMCDKPDMYLKSPAKNFLNKLVANWDDIIFIDGYPGQFTCIARRHGNDWFIAGINAGDERKVSLNLSFLKEGEYKVKLYGDGKNPIEDLKIDDITVSSENPLEIIMARNGGFVIFIGNSY